MYYHEVFEAGNQRQGSYRCQAHITDPAGFILGPGAGDAPYAAPAAREHGQPVAASAAAMPPPLSGTESACPPDVTARLKIQVDLACKTQKSKCTAENSCPKLLARIAVAKACVAARETIMNQCFGGGDADHIEELRRRRVGLQTREKIYLKKCDPSPQPVPISQPVPSHRDDTAPKPPKINPAVPVGLTGAALLLYYFWEVVEGALLIL
ncbi:MAG: hypothetical protein EOO56_09815 [Hymenobacter sp.]|nr:MAG: hypothetical protein EOO56_09815 [Hymenobacter sp.]